MSTAGPLEPVPPDATPPTAGKKGSAPRAVVWTMAARQGERILGVISISILARALSPADFGLVAMATSVVAIIDVMSSFGFDWSLIRLQNATPAHYNTAWTLRVLAGTFVGLLILAAAWPASIYYHRPAVGWVIAAMGCNSIILSLENMWMAEYRRLTRFEPEFQMRIGAKVAGFLAGVGCALLTHSYWSLVVGTTAANVAAVSLSYRLHHSKPRWDLSRRSDLMRFSIWLMGSNIMETLRTRLSDVWIGRHLGSSFVGNYALASEISSLAGTELVSPINRVVFANYAEIQNDLPAMNRTYLRVVSVIWLVAFPAGVGIWACAKQVVAVLLGAQWTDAALVLQILAAAGLLKVMAANTYYVYLALGRAAFATGLSFVGVALFVVFMLVLGPIGGMLGIAWAQVVSSTIVVFINLTVLFRTLKIAIRDFVSYTYRIVLASFAMGAVVWKVGAILEAGFNLPRFIELAVMVATGAAIYVLALLALWRIAGKPTGAESEILGIAGRWLGSRWPRLGLGPKAGGKG